MCSIRPSLADMLKRPAVELRLVGAEGDEDEDKSKGESQDEDKSKDPDGKQEDSDKSKQPEFTLEQAKNKIAALTDEKDRHFSARTRAEARVTELEAEVRDLRDKGADDAGKAELIRLRDENAALKVDLQDARLERAFLADNGYQWHSPTAALRLADLSDVEIDDKGKVTGLKAALERLATEHDYLLVKDTDGQPKPKTGDQPKPKQKQDEASKAAKESKYRQKYSGLRR